MSKIIEVYRIEGRCSLCHHPVNVWDRHCTYQFGEKCTGPHWTTLFGLLYLVPCHSCGKTGYIIVYPVNPYDESYSGCVTIDYGLRLI